MPFAQVRSAIQLTLSSEKELSAFVDLGKGLKRHTKRAASSATRKMRTIANKMIREDRPIKLKALKGLVTPVLQGNTPIGINVSGKPIPVVEMPFLKNTRKKYVRATLKKGKGRTTLQGSFVATMKSGHKGVFRRKGEERLPIKELFSTGVASTFKSTSAKMKVLDAGRREYYATMKRLTKA